MASYLAGIRTAASATEVTLIDKETAHVWKPMLHTIAAGTRDVAGQQASYLAQAGRHGFMYELGEALSVDIRSRQIAVGPLCDHVGDELVPARSVHYDTLILSAGSRANDFGTPGVAEHCSRLDSRTEALAFNDEVRLRMLRCLASNASLEIGIVGGGAIGVELAAELVKLARISGSYGAKSLPDRMRISLLDRGDRLLTAFPERISAAAKDRLEKLGVNVLLAADVSAAEAEGFRLRDGSLVACHLKLWATGVKAAKLMDGIEGLDMTKGGQIASEISRQAPAANPAWPESGFVQISGFRIAGLPGRLRRLRHSRAFRFFKGGFIKGRVAQLGHALLYREHQIRLNGWVRGSMLWLIDSLAERVRPPIKLD